MQSKQSLKKMARKLWGNNRRLRHQWLTAVQYLRQQSRDGWLHDRPVSRMETQQEQRA
jgi:hypothetical protein